MRGQKDLKTIKTGVNKIKNQREDWYEMFQNGQMTDFDQQNRPTLGQSIPRTKWDRDQLSLSSERVHQ